jgi:predicted phage terminase large subunit-like protein
MYKKRKETRARGGEGLTPISEDALPLDYTAIKSQHGRQEMFLSSTEDIAIYGGAAGGGKTFSLLTEPLYHVHDPMFGAVIFRRIYPQITTQGGLWDESKEIYLNVRPAPYAKPGDLSWIFPSGAKISFRQMQHEDSKYNYQGAQIPLIGFDQLEQFTESQFFFMMSRNRSSSTVQPYIRATANPQPGWLADFIDWWLDEEGYAIPERIGKRRYFIRDGNTLVWADTKEELLKINQQAIPKSVTFIPASVYDNPIMLAKNPQYLASLMALPELERKRLLGDKVKGGNWHIRPGGILFKRHWFVLIPEAPANFEFVCRFWDMAATPALALTDAKGNDPDWTVGAKVGLKDGIWYILNVKRGRWSPEESQRVILQTAIEDGRSVSIRMEQEGGSAGKIAVSHFAREVLVGFDFLGIPSSGSKEVRARPLASSGEAGNVRMLIAPWNTQALDELESFSLDCLHDDVVDAISGAYNSLAESRIDPTMTSGVTSGSRMLTKLEREMLDAANAITDPDERTEALKILYEAGLR